MTYQHTRDNVRDWADPVRDQIDDDTADTIARLWDQVAAVYATDDPDDPDTLGCAEASTGAAMYVLGHSRKDMAIRPDPGRYRPRPTDRRDHRRPRRRRHTPGHMHPARYSPHHPQPMDSRAVTPTLRTSSRSTAPQDKRQKPLDSQYLLQ